MKFINFSIFFIIVFYEIFTQNYDSNLSTQNYLLEAFAKLPNHINYLHPNNEYMTILYIYHNLACICY